MPVFSFCETHTISDVTAFVSEEHRASVLTYVIDLYADNLETAPNAGSLPDAHLDKSDYYAMSREIDGENLERQFNMLGGLRWEFEEHVKYKCWKTDRIALFKAIIGPGAAARSHLQ